jgi:hypothetical protein
MKTTVEISDPLLEQAKELASEQGLTLRNLIENGFRSVIASHASSTSKPFKLRDGSFKGRGGLQPGVNWSDLTRSSYDEESIFKK